MTKLSLMLEQWKRARIERVWKWIAIALSIIVVFTQVVDVSIALRPQARKWLRLPYGAAANGAKVVASPSDENALSAAVLPQNGAPLPIRWGDFGKKLVETGVIDIDKFAQVYAGRGGLVEADRDLLTKDIAGPVIITAQNSGVWLNILWAFGLAQKNPILEKGPISDPSYGGAGNFASTGGWTLAKGKAMDHFSKHALITLTPEQQSLVEKVSQNIFRPCCGNATHFPDCNHGMAMLGLLEIMASQGADEAQMYRTALAVNSYWFPDTYVTIAKFLASKGIQWQDADPASVLGAQFSSAQGYRQIMSQVAPQPSKGGSGCGV